MKMVCTCIHFSDGYSNKYFQVLCNEEILCTCMHALAANLFFLAMWLELIVRKPLDSAIAGVQIIL